MTDNIVRVERDGVEFFTLTLTGESGMSISGLAQSCGVSKQSVSERLASGGEDYKLDTGRVSVSGKRGSFQVVIVRDTVCAEVIAHYAQQGKPEAIRSLIGFAAMGIRSFIHTQTGWTPNRRLTDAEIADICLLPTGRDWKKQFGDDYYYQLSRLTGLTQEGHKRPALWGKLTDEWVYKMLPVGVREGVKKAKLDQGDWSKLHQYLSDDGLEVFRVHMQALKTTMQGADSVNGVRRALKNITRSEYQYRLFDDCRKDGKLTINRNLNEFQSQN